MRLFSRIAHTRLRVLAVAAIALASLFTAPVARAQLLLKSGGTGAQNNLLIQLVATSNHIDPVTGITPTVTIRKANGGTTFAAPAGAVTEIGNGWYQVAANAADTSAVGELIVHATGTGADVADRTYYVVAYDPTDAAGLGLSRLDAAISGVSAAVLNTPVLGTMTAKKALGLNAALSVDADRTWTSSTHTAVYTWYARDLSTNAVDKTKPVCVKTTVYDSTNVQVVSQTTVLTLTNLP